MTHIVVIRGYKPGDELYCGDMVKETIMSTLNSAFIANLFKESTFQLMILCAAIMFIFFGWSFTVCLLIIPIVIIGTYIATYLGYVMIAAETTEEIRNVPRYDVVYVYVLFSFFIEN